MRDKKGVILFVKYPNLGEVKTRLASKTNKNFALEFYKIVAEYVFNEIGKLGPGIDILLFYSGKDSLSKIKSWVKKDFLFFPQNGEDLGERMSDAFFHAFKNNYEMVLILGSDIPEISVDTIGSAFSYLSESNVVISPSEDGGYSLLGTDKYYPLLYQNIEWSSDSVFEKTKEVIESNNLHLKVLPVLNDVDTLPDLKKWLMNSKNSKLTGKIKLLSEKENIPL